MLPLWRNRVYIAISPGRISLVKLGRGLKPKLLAQFDEAVEPSGNTQAGWQRAVDKLAHVLSLSEWHNADVDVVLSNRLVRFALISANTKLKKYAAKEAFARHVMSQIYGAVSSQWSLRLQQGKATEHCLAGAVDQALLDQLKIICSNNKLKLDQVVPWLVPVFNQYRKQIKADPAWLVLNEPGASLCLLMKGGEIISVSNVNHESINDLPMLLDRENLVSTLAEPCKTVYLYSPTAGNLSATNMTGYLINKFEMPSVNDFTANEYAPYAILLGGVK